MVLITLLNQAADGGVQLPDFTSSQYNNIVMALIAIIATSIAALVYVIKNNVLGKSISKDASEANKAVNNIGPGEHRLYDVIKSIETKQAEFDRRWGNLPDNIDDAVSLSETIHDIHISIKNIDTKLDAHIARENGPI
jgi:hypothetical protein